MSIAYNEAERKAQREQVGFMITVIGALATVGINELPVWIAPEVASEMGPILTVSTLLLAIPTWLGFIVYATGGSRIVVSLIYKFIAVVAAITILGVLMIPPLLWTGMVP